MRTRAETRHARTGELAGRGLKVSFFDALDRPDDHGAAALEIFVGEGLLAIFLESRRPADAEDVLPHAAPNPVVRVPEREQSRLKAEGAAVLVSSVLPRPGVERELHVPQAHPEGHPVSRTARAV